MEVWKMSEYTIDHIAFSGNQSETKADFDKVGRFKFAINSTLGWLSAFFCLVCLLIPSFIFMLPPILAMAVGSWNVMMKADWFDP
jgi:hypothetical protein